MMNRFVLICLSLLALLAPGAIHAQELPNVVLIFTDDKYYEIV